MLSVAGLAASSIDGWQELRRRTSATIWDGGNLPNRSTPDGLVKNISVPGLSKLTWSLMDPVMTPTTLNSTVYHSLRRPTNGALRSSNTVVVHHHGHAKACDKTLRGETEWRSHVEGKRHRNRIAALRKKREGKHGIRQQASAES